MVQPSGVHQRTDATDQFELSASAGAKFGDEFENSDANRLRASNARESTLPFVAVSTNGGQYSTEHSCQQLFQDDKSCYSSQLSCKQGINIIAKHSGPQYCTIDGISFRIPTEGYSCPTAQAIILTSWDEPDLAGLQDFDHVQSQQDFDAMSETWSQKVDLSRPMPLAFVDTSHKYTTSVNLKVPRSGKFVIVKLLRPRHPAGDNIDAEFVGLHGWSGRRCIPCRLPVLL